MLLIVLMSATTFTTQRQLMMKNMPASALDNPFAKQQKVLLYLMPIFFAVSGVNFPIGVLIYWTVTNIWSMCQQFYVIRRMPAPGSPAEKAMQERRKKRGKPVEEFTVKGLDAAPDAVDTTEQKTSGQRQQPKRKKKGKGSAAKPRGQPAGGSAAGQVHRWPFGRFGRQQGCRCSQAGQRPQQLTSPRHSSPLTCTHGVVGRGRWPLGPTTFARRAHD